MRKFYQFNIVLHSDILHSGMLFQFVNSRRGNSISLIELSKWRIGINVWGGGGCEKNQKLAISVGFVSAEEYLIY